MNEEEKLLSFSSAGVLVVTRLLFQETATDKTVTKIGLGLSLLNVH